MAELRAALDLSLREVGAMFDVSAQTVFRWEHGDRPVPPHVVVALGLLVAETSPDEDVVLSAVGAGGKTGKELRDELRAPRLVAELDRLLASGSLCTAEVSRPDGLGRYYRREGIFKASTADRRGLDRAAPLASGRSLAAARRSQGLTVEDLATRVRVAPSTLRTWEAASPPRARIPMLAAALDDGPSGAQIRRARRAARWSQSALGERVGVGFQTVQGWEAGRRPVPLGRKVRLLEALAEAHDASRRRPEEAMRRIELDVLSAPGTSKAEYRHSRRVTTQGKSRFDPEVDSALRALLRTGRLGQALTVRFDSQGRPRTRMCLFPPDAAPLSLPATSGDRVGQLRTSLGWTQRQLAQELGVSPGLISTWERRQGGTIPGYWTTRVADVVRDCGDRPTSEARAREAILATVNRQPGIARWTLLQEVDHSKHTRRAISALIDEGAIVRQDAWDSVGRRHPGYFVSSHSAPALRIEAGELRARRVDSGITAAELGEALGVRGNAVTRWETGVRGCPQARMSALLEFFDSGLADTKSHDA
jgi:transcriptional regulator with XRE-family HTH domain